MSKKILFEELSKRGFMPQHVAEIGVYRPETSNVLDYIRRGVKCTLVEPDPESIQIIRNYFSDYDNITLHQAAIYDFNGQIELVRRNASTFVRKLTNSPAIVNDAYRLNEDDIYVVESKTFDEIDDGTIDLLSADIEGCEWFVIKHMKSRPTIISLETHGSMYVNPFLNEILNWMNNNDYEMWYRTGSDTVFIKKGEIKIVFLDKGKLILRDIFISLRRFRKRLTKKLLRIHL